MYIQYSCASFEYACTQLDCLLAIMSNTLFLLYNEAAYTYSTVQTSLQHIEKFTNYECDVTYCTTGANSNTKLVSRRSVHPTQILLPRFAMLCRKPKSTNI